MNDPHLFRARDRAEPLAPRRTATPLLLALGLTCLAPAACAAPAAAASDAMPASAAAAPAGSITFLPGWQEHSHALIFHGFAREGGRSIWMVPSILPRGDYVVISRHEGVPRLVPGQRVHVSDPFAKILLFIDNGYGSPEAVDARFVSTKGVPR